MTPSKSCSSQCERRGFRNDRIGSFSAGQYLLLKRLVYGANPHWSLAHVALAAAHARLGNRDAAGSAATQILKLQPNYSVGEMCASFKIHASLARPLSEALIEAGLPP